MGLAIIIGARRRVRYSSCLLLVGALFSVGCEPDGAELVVSARTDFVAGEEMGALRVVLNDPSGVLVNRQEAPALLGQDFRIARPVAAFSGLTPGIYRLEVSALDLRGDILVARAESVRIEGSFARTVTLRAHRRTARAAAGGGRGASAASEGRRRVDLC